MFNRRNSVFGRQSRTEGPFTLFDGKPLNILQPNEGVAQCDGTMKTWNKCESYELFLSSSFAPRNYFEKMIYWTIEGKVWQFPIDNEQGKLF